VEVLSELQHALTKEASILESLSRCVQDELDSLRSQDNERLSLLVNDKTTLLARVDLARQERERLVRLACKEATAEEETLSALVGQLQPDAAAPIARLRLEILGKMKELRRQNVAGRRYVRRHMRFIHEAKAALSGDETFGTGEYGPAGTTRNAPGGGLAVNATV